jgi:hypothetical protein
MAWEKWQSAIFIDAAADGAGTHDWARIGKSTVYDLTFNADIQTMEFIEDKNPSDLIKNYKPTISQELYTLEGDKAFDYVYSLMYNLPVGDGAVRKALFVFPKEGADGCFDAWLADVTIVVTNYRPVEQKILFDLNFCGDIEKGKVAVSGGVPVFTAA